MTTNTLAAKAAHEALSAIYFADSSDYLPALRTITSLLAPDLAALLEKDGSLAWHTSDVRANGPDALAAQALPAAEPVAWWIPKAEQFALAKPSGSRPFASAWEPLYAAPQAAKQAEQSTTGGGVTTGAPSEPFGYFKAEPFGWTDCAETDDGAVALYEGPQQAAQAPAGWQPIETAPRGNGDDPSIKLVTDPRWIEPPMVLLLFRGGETAVGRWDWYYADGGSGRIDGCAWVEPTSGGVLSQHYDPPTHWMPLPQPQPQSAQTKGDA